MSGAHFRKNLQLLEDCLTRDAHPKSLAFLLDPARLASFRPGFEQAVAKHVQSSSRQLLESIAVITHGCPSRKERSARPRTLQETNTAAPYRRGGTPAPASGLPTSQATATRWVAVASRNLAGCGFGLTPSGDDFLAGVLVALNVLDHVPSRGTRRRRVPTPKLRNAIAAAARSDNPLTNVFLDLARRGRVGAKQQALIATLLAGTPRAVRAAARVVLAVGATSGADFSTGFLLTLKSGMNSRS